MEREKAFEKGLSPFFCLLGDTPRPQSVLFFGAKKRTKRNIHPNQTFPYMGRLNLLRGKTALRKDFGMNHEAFALKGDS